MYYATVKKSFTLRNVVWCVPFLYYSHAGSSWPLIGQMKGGRGLLMTVTANRWVLSGTIGPRLFTCLEQDQRLVGHRNFSFRPDSGLTVCELTQQIRVGTSRLWGLRPQNHYFF